MREGILTGCNCDYERYLPWWYRHVRKHNDTPIAILDFGMSPWGIAQARQMGEVIDAKAPSGIKATCIFEHAKAIAESCFRRIINAKKSPFEISLWIDVDCMVRCDVSPLFPYANHPSGFAVAEYNAENKETLRKHLRTEKIFNGGVHVFKKGNPIYEFWPQAIADAIDQFHFDDLTLATALEKQGKEVNWFSADYNSEFSDAKIRHFYGRRNKKILFHDPNYRHYPYPVFDHPTSDNFGIELRVDKSNEKYLDWWMKNYRMFNNHPVAINKNPFETSLSLTPCHMVHGYLEPSTKIWNYNDAGTYMPYAKIIDYDDAAGKRLLANEIVIGSMIHTALAGP